MGNQKLLYFIVGALMLVASANAAPIKLPETAIRVPIIRQATHYSCGAAVLMSIFYYWDVYDGCELLLHDFLGTNSNHGTPPEQIVATAKDFELHAETHQGLTLQSLEVYLEVGATVILNIQAWAEDEEGISPNFSLEEWKKEYDHGHYVVLVGMDSHYAYFMDPSVVGSYTYMTRDELVARWHDQVEKNGIKTYFDRLGIVIFGDTPNPPSPDVIVKTQ